MIRDLDGVAAWLSALGAPCDRVGASSLIVASPLGGHEAAMLLTWGRTTLQLSQGIVLVQRGRNAEAAVTLAELNLRLDAPGLVVDERGLVSYRVALPSAGGLEPETVRRAVHQCIESAAAVLPELQALAGRLRLAAGTGPMSVCAGEVLGYLA